MRVERLNPTVQFRVKLQSKKKLLTKLVTPVSQSDRTVSGQEVGHYNLLISAIIMLISAIIMLISAL